MARVLSATGFLGAALAFTLPFGSVTSCAGGEAHFTGVELATLSVSADGYADGEVASEVETNGGPFAALALGAAMVGLCLAALGLAGASVCAALGLLAMQALLYGIAISGDGGDLYRGFGLALAGFVAASVVYLLDAIRTRRRRGLSVWPPVAWGLAVVVPPVGLALVGLCALIVWCARRLRVAVRRRPASA